MKLFKIFFDMEKEAQWLNEQLQKGYRCTNISAFGVYTFQETDKRYVLRIDYQDHLSKRKFEEYKDIYEDFGWIYIKRVTGFWPGRKYYWQKENAGQNELFSDRQSKGHYYKRLMGYSFLLGIFCFIVLEKDFSMLYHKALWSMEGDLFWKAFVFETPFVFLKLLPAFMVILFGISFYKAYRNYAMLKER